MGWFARRRFHPATAGRNPLSHASDTFVGACILAFPGGPTLLSPDNARTGLGDFHQSHSLGNAPNQDLGGTNAKREGQKLWGMIETLCRRAFGSPRDFGSNHRVYFYGDFRESPGFRPGHVGKGLE